MSHTDDIVVLCDVQLRKIVHSNREGSGIRNNSKGGILVLSPDRKVFASAASQVRLIAHTKKHG